jgi:hypothetical protein
MYDNDFKDFDELSAFVKEDFRKNLRSSDSLGAFRDTTFHDTIRKVTIIRFFPKEPCYGGEAEYVIDKEKLRIVNVTNGR